MPKQVQSFDDATRKIAKLLGKPGATKRIQTGQIGDAGAAGSQRFVNPMTAQDDLIVGGTSGALTRLAKGSHSQVLTVDPITHHLIWATPAAAYTNEMAQDAVGGILTDSSSVDFTYDDALNTITAAVIDEYIRDLVGGLLVSGSNVTITVDDAGNTITIDATGGSSYTDEQVRDVIGAALVAGNNIDITVNDGADTITIDVEALTEADIASLVSDLATLSAASHAAVTVTDGTGIDLTLTGQNITAEPIFAGTGSAGTVSHSDHSHTAGTVPAVTSGVDLAKWVSGNYIARIDMVGALDLSTTGNALTADTMQAGLFPVVADSLGNLPTFDQVAINVTNLIALSTIRLGVYAMGTDGKPGALIADWGTVSSASTGDKTLSISWAPSAGQYYLVMVSTHGPSVLRQTTGRHAPIGHTTIGTFSQATDYTRALAGSSAGLPNPFGTPVAVTNHRPIWLRVA